MGPGNRREEFAGLFPDIQEQGVGVAQGLTEKLPMGEGNEGLIKRVGEKLLVKNFLEVCIHEVRSMSEK